MQVIHPAAAPILYAIDPGGTTGWAAFSEDLGFDSGQVTDRFGFYHVFYELVSLARPLVVVCERFTITGATVKKSPQLDPLYIIGHIEALCYKLGHQFHLQLPSEAMSFATDTKLSRVEWFRPGQVHANDAARHLLTWMVKSQSDAGVELLRRLAPAEESD